MPKKNIYSYQLDKINKDLLKKEIFAQLEQRFTHADFIRLNRKWKLIHCDQEASILAMHCEIVLMRLHKEGKIKIKGY